jgi:putative ABC transport system ATP-binding protein
MHDLNRTLGLTFLFSTHDQRLLEHTDRIVRLTDGQIVSDTHTAESLNPNVLNPQVFNPQDSNQGASHGQVLAARL